MGRQQVPLGRLLEVVTATRVRRITLSFDNGPGPEVTPQVLGVLGRAAVRASFFALGGKLRDPAATQPPPRPTPPLPAADGPYPRDTSPGPPWRRSHRW